MKRTLTVVGLSLLTSLAIVMGMLSSRPTPVHAQQYGVGTVVGGVTPVNQFPQTVSGSLAGAVTNPASNFIINVAGGPVYYGGVITEIAQSTLTLPANSTNMVVFSGILQQVYSKQAVTGPGSSGTTVGVPTSLLFADPNRGEIALATVVCNATACGNGGNGSITDNRAVNNFPAGQYIGGHLNSTVAGTTAAMAFQGTCTLAANTCTMTFTQAFQSAPVCVATDQTTPQLVKAPATTASVVVTDTVGATDVVSVICVGNPN